jgi:hypothetical protein
MKGRPELIERDLVKAAERCERLPDQERIALADRLADLARDFQSRAWRLSQTAFKVRTGSDHPLQR